MLSLAGSLGLLVVSIAGWTWARPPAVVTGVTFLLPALWLIWGSVLAAMLSLALVTRTGALGRFVGAQLGGGVVVFLLVWGRAWAPALPGEGTVRVMSWNVQRLGWEDPERAARIDCVVASVTQADPDLLVLLELDARDLVELEGRLDLACEHTDYRGTGRENHGGLAACTRGSEWSLGLHAPRAFSTDEPWYYVFTEAVHASGVVNLMAVHLRPYEVARFGLTGGSDPEDISASQQEAARDLLVRVEALRDPTVVAGDFNSGRDAALHVGMRRHLVDTWEAAGLGPGRTVWALGWLPLRIDYVYATRDFTVVDSEIPAWDCSDHRPVLSELRWR